MLVYRMNRLRGGEGGGRCSRVGRRNKKWKLCKVQKKVVTQCDW